LGLLLGAHEENRAAVSDGVLDEGIGAIDILQGLLQVDDVDPVTFGEDETLHLRVPPTGLMPEVDAALEELAHGDDSHCWSSPTAHRRGSGAPGGARFRFCCHR